MIYSQKCITFASDFGNDTETANKMLNIKNYAKMKVLKQKSVVIDEDYTIHKRIVKLEDGSGLFQLHVSCDPKFRTYNSGTFSTLKSAMSLYGEP